MRILIYNDKLNELAYLYTMIKEIHLDLIIDKSYNKDEFFKYYSSNNYDIVCIEYFDTAWAELLKKIIILNDKQRIILLSDDRSCSQINNCDNCQKNLNVNVVIKPILDHEITYLFSKKNICEEYLKSGLEFNLLKICKRLNIKYESINIDINTHIFTFNKISENQKIIILTELVYELNKLNIK